MCPRLMLGALLVAIAACAPAGTGFTEDDAAHIRQMGQDYARMAVAGATDSILGRRTEDVVWMPPNADRVVGKAAVREAMAGFPPAIAFTVVSERVEGSGDLAYDRGRYEFTFVAGADTVTDIGKYWVLYRRQADRSWLTAVEMWSSNAPAATEPTP